MKLSILIPMYNASKYIGNCLDSLINQDIPKNEYEIIVMDDGSTDESVSIVEAYVNINDNIILYKESNVGAYSTRNKLLELAKGDYIYNIDADDYIVNNSIGLLLKIAIKNDVDILGFETLQTQSLKLNHSNFESKLLISSVLTGYKFLKDYRHLRHEIWWYITKRSFLTKTKLKFNSNEYFADLLFTLKLICQSKKIIYFKSSIHRYVQTNDSLMRSNDFIDRLKQIDNMFLVIIDYSEFINNIVIDKKDNLDKVINNLKFRRDSLTFFTIIKMIRFNTDKIKTKDQIEKLKIAKAYPIKCFIGEEYNSLLYRLLVLIINSQRFLMLSSLMFRSLNFYKTKFDQ